MFLRALRTIAWEKVDATLVDKRFVSRSSYNIDRPSASYEVWEYMVQLPGLDGRPKRLAFNEKSFEVELPTKTKTVPILVNKKRTKATFDLSDARIGFRVKQRQAEQRAKEKQAEAAARFERNL